jgi:hypothetical protein
MKIIHQMLMVKLCNNIHLLLIIYAGVYSPSFESWPTSTYWAILLNCYEMIYKMLWRRYAISCLLIRYNNYTCSIISRSNRRTFNAQWIRPSPLMKSVRVCELVEQDLWTSQPLFISAFFRLPFLYTHPDSPHTHLLTRIPVATTKKSGSNTFILYF